jgi:hypothetical protein
MGGDEDLHCRIDVWQGEKSGKRDEYVIAHALHGNDRLLRCLRSKGS